MPSPLGVSVFATFGGSASAALAAKLTATLPTIATAAATRTATMATFALDPGLQCIRFIRTAPFPSPRPAALRRETRQTSDNFLMVSTEYP